MRPDQPGSSKPHRVAVIGGGPAGLMAASVLGQAGLRVTVYEAHRSPGRKFVLAGRSGLNLTNGEPLEQFVARYGPDCEFMDQALDGFGPGHLRAWADGLGAATFVGSSGRVFPQAMKSTPLLRAWLSQLGESQVDIKTGHRWVGLGDGQQLRFDTVEGPVTRTPDATVLALGGASWPRVSSDGSWAQILAERGVAMAPFAASNCGIAIAWTEVLKQRFEGTPVKNVSVTVPANTKPSPNNPSPNIEGDRVRGDITITRTGLEGGPIYAQSRALRQALGSPHGASIEIDLVPDLSPQAFAARLANRRAKSTVTSWLRGAGLSPAAIALMREANGNNLATSAAAMAETAKRTQLNVDGLATIDKAISTVGGVALSGIDENQMLRCLPGVFAAGEMLDWDAPTGGYLLQACFSTGVGAARGVLKWLS